MNLSTIINSVENRGGFTSGIDSANLPSNTLTIDYNTSTYYEVALSTIGLSVETINFPTNEFGFVLLGISGGGSFPVTWLDTGLKWVLSDGTYGTAMIDTGIDFKSTGDMDFVMLFSNDGGTTVYAKIIR